MDKTIEQITVRRPLALAAARARIRVPITPSVEFSPQQRVGLALELFDEGEDPQSPQALVQALPFAPTMIRLSPSAVSIVSPV